VININNQRESVSGVPLSYHRVQDVRMSPDGLALLIRGGSWASVIQCESGMSPLEVWMERIELATLATSQGLLADIGASLITGELFAGGQIVPSPGVSVEQTQAMKWTEIKGWRQAAFDAPLQTPYGTFHSHRDGRAEISDSVLLAQTMLSLDPNYAITYTLVDNSVITLTIPEMVNVGLMLGAKMQAAYARARDLRVQVYDSEATVGSIQALQWESI
jgi:hypothetical protein